MNERERIVLLCSDGASTRAVYKALSDRFGGVTVVMEPPLSRSEMVKKRIKRLGIIKVTGQVLFAALVVPLLSRRSGKRIAEIELEYGLAKEWDNVKPIEVDSVNSEKTREILRELQPDIVVVNGTGIIGRKTLQSVNAVFINTHAGITPLYRGVHGAYWARAEGRPELVGTTVHFVDEGIDTGNIIDQAFFEVTEKDNFATYPYLHTAAGIPILLKAVEKSIHEELKPKTGIMNLPSKLRYHPTIWEYLVNRLKIGVK